jgi:hypothetical protein
MFFQDLRSVLLKPSACINFICFRTVDFPLSPAPVNSNQRSGVSCCIFRTKSLPRSKILTSLSSFFLSTRNFFSISLFLRPAAPELPARKHPHGIVEIAGKQNYLEFSKSTSNNRKSKLFWRISCYGSTFAVCERNRDRGREKKEGLLTKTFPD